MKLCRWTQNWRETRPRRQKMRLECGERKSRREENLQICLRPTEPLGKPAALLLYYSHNIEVNYIGALTVGAVQFQFVNQKQKQQRIFWTTADVISSNLIKHISTGLHDEAVTNSLSVHQIKVSAVSFFFSWHSSESWVFAGCAVKDRRRQRETAHRVAGGAFDFASKNCESRGESIDFLN